MIDKLLNEYRKFGIEYDPVDKEFIFRKPIPVMDLIIFRYFLNKYNIEYSNIRVIEKKRTSLYRGSFI